MENRVIYFTNKEEGLKLLKKDFLINSDFTKTEYANDLVEFIESQFSSELSTSLIMETIQLFRQWDHEEDVEGVEVFHNIELSDSYNIEDIEEYCYLDGTPVSVGVRIGVIENINHNEVLSLDYGILKA